MLFRNALAFAFLAISVGQAVAQQATARFPAPSSFHGAQATIELCKVLLQATPISFALSEDDGNIAITAHMRSQSQAESLRSLLVGVPFLTSSAKSDVQPGNEGSSDITFNGQVNTATVEVGVPETAPPRSELLPLFLVNQIAVESGVMFERFVPDEPVYIGPYWLRITQFSVSGTCEQFTTLLDRLRPHSDSVVPTSNKLAFDAKLKRPLRWSAELHLRSLD